MNYNLCLQHVLSEASEKQAPQRGCVRVVLQLLRRGEKVFTAPRRRSWQAGRRRSDSRSWAGRDCIAADGSMLISILGSAQNYQHLFLCKRPRMHSLQGYGSACGSSHPHTSTKALLNQFCHKLSSILLKHLDLTCCWLAVLFSEKYWWHQNLIRKRNLRENQPLPQYNKKCINVNLLLTLTQGLHYMWTLTHIFNQPIMAATL